MTFRDIPLEPDAETARRWLEEELSKPEYRGGGNWLQQVLAWLNTQLERLLSTGSGSGGLSAPTMVVLALLGALLTGAVIYLVVGPLRRSRATRRSASVFEDDEREATDIRSAAVNAALAEDWDTAVIERFRALVRGAEERHLVAVVPGMTAMEFTHEAGRRLPHHARDLATCADAFDGIRYGHTHATRALYDLLAATDDAIARAKPVVHA